MVEEFIDGLLKHNFYLKKSGTQIVQLPENLAHSTRKIPINTKKIDKLKQLKPYIEEKYMDFYNTIYEWPTSEEAEKDEDEVF